MELLELLEKVDAPAALLEWARAEGVDFEEAWSRCARADHRLWLAAVGGAPIEAVIEAAAQVVLAAEDELAFHAPVVTEAIHAAISADDPEALLAAAEAAEAFSRGGVSGYREALPPGYDAIARGAALLSHAAEARVAAEAAREARRLEEARHRGATLGVGASIALPARAGPARLEVLAGANDPAQGALLFSVAASAQAVVEAAEALAEAMGRAASTRWADRGVREALESEPRSGAPGSPLRSE